MEPLIAIVNDDRRLLQVAGDLLRRGGFRTAAHMLAAEAHAALCAQRPDLILLGLAQERPDAGWQLLTLTRLDDRLAGIPVILCSADSRLLNEKASWLRAMQCEVLVEPYTEHALLAKVQATFAPVGVWRGVA